MADPIKTIDNYMHAQGHSFEAADLARAAHEKLVGAPADGLATLALAVAELADAISGIISTRVDDIADAAGIDLDNPPAH